MSINEAEDFAPPLGPPPLFNEDQLVQLARQGFLPLSLTNELTSDLQCLFQRLEAFYDQDLDTKKFHFPEKLGTEFGYYHIEGEKEYVTLRCRSSFGGDRGLETLAARVWQQAGVLLHRILGDIARATDLPCSVWDQLLGGTLTLPEDENDMTSTLLRMFKYLPDQGLAEQHTDLGLLTLCVGTRPGLQCLKRDEEEPYWVDAAGPVVLVGKTLTALSNGLIRPGIHKVVPNPEGRYSIVYALRHSFKHQIDLERFGGEGSIDPKKLWERIKAGVVNINATKELRGKMRQERDEKRKADIGGQG